MMGAWNEARRERRRRRKRVEEILGWIVVPPLLIGIWLAGSYLYTAFEEPISQVVQAVQTILNKQH
ncbi:hypothetical protein ACERNI_00655 [Camelimonas sp. ID_303_24]